MVQKKLTVSPFVRPINAQGSMSSCEGWEPSFRDMPVKGIGLADMQVSLSEMQRDCSRCKNFASRAATPACRPADSPVRPASKSFPARMRGRSTRERDFQPQCADAPRESTIFRENTRTLHVRARFSARTRGRSTRESDFRRECADASRESTIFRQNARMLHDFQRE